MTLNGVMAVPLRYFTEFGKPAFQLITASSSVELIDQKSASTTHRAVKLVCVTKFTQSRTDTKLAVSRFMLLTFNLSSKFHFTVAPRGDDERRPVAKFMRDYTVSYSTCTMSS